MNKQFIFSLMSVVQVLSKTSFDCFNSALIAAHDIEEITEDISFRGKEFDKSFAISSLRDLRGLFDSCGVSLPPDLANKKCYDLIDNFIEEENWHKQLLAERRLGELVDRGLVIIAIQLKILKVCLNPKVKDVFYRLIVKLLSA